MEVDTEKLLKVIDLKNDFDLIWILMNGMTWNWWNVRWRFIGFVFRWFWNCLFYGFFFSVISEYVLAGSVWFIQYFYGRSNEWFQQLKPEL